MPIPGAGAEAYAALWALAFDYDDPGSNWGAKQTLTLDRVKSNRNPFGLRLVTP